MVTPGWVLGPKGAGRRPDASNGGTLARLLCWVLGANRTASAFIFYFTADNAPSGTRNLSKRFNGDLGGERRADGRTPGDYHVA